VNGSERIPLIPIIRDDSLVFGQLRQKSISLDAVSCDFLAVNRSGTVEELAEILPFRRAAHTMLRRSPESTLRSWFISARVASLRQWRIQKETYQPVPIAGEVQEELRQYLLGTAPFPASVVSMVYVSTSDVPPLTAGFPDSVFNVGIDTHRFYIPGLWFHLMLGEGLTDDHRRMCILRSPVHPISLSVLGDKLVHAIAFSLYWTSKTRT
jgi:hypothetical protein